MYNYNREHMRKWLLLVLILLAIAAACLYFIIPNRLIVSGTESISVNAKAFSRTILDEEKWKQWWPGTVLTKETNVPFKYEYNGSVYSIAEKKLSSIVLNVQTEHNYFTTELVFLPLKADSVVVNWQGQQPASFQPLDRLKQFSRIKKLNKDLAVILGKLKSFCSNDSNFYRLLIKKDRVVDSVLISTSNTTKGYPGVESIYAMIDQLKAFAQKNGAKQTGLPMLNVITNDSISFLNKVALPVDKKLKDEGNIVYRRMLGRGNILVAEVKGGPYTIQKGFEAIEKYTEDHNRIAPAIFFQSLVTDRRQQPDSSKWVTKLYWPVM
jgi:hypothetical protein